MDNDQLSVASPWLLGPAPTAALARDRLEERILNLLSSQNMCGRAMVSRYRPGEIFRSALGAA